MTTISLLFGVILFFYVLTLQKNFFNKLPLLILIVVATGYACNYYYIKDYKKDFFAPNLFDSYLVTQELNKCNDDIDCKYDVLKMKDKKEGVFTHQNYLLSKHNLKTFCDMEDKDGFIYWTWSDFCKIIIDLPTYEKYKQDYFHLTRKECSMKPTVEQVNECISLIENEIKDQNSDFSQEIDKAYNKDIDYLKTLQLNYNQISNKNIRNLASQLFKVDFIELWNDKISLYSEKYTEKKVNIVLFHVLWQMLYDNGMACLYPNNMNDISKEELKNQIEQCQNNIINDFIENKWTFSVENVEKLVNLNYLDVKDVVRHTLPSLYEITNEYNALKSMLEKDFWRKMNAEDPIFNNHYLKEYVSNWVVKYDKYIKKLKEIKENN